MGALFITINGDQHDLALQAFPFMPEQYIDGETYNGADKIDQVVVEINLADRDDTTAAQEQYLNTNPAVVSYEVR